MQGSVDSNFFFFLKSSSFFLIFISFKVQTEKNDPLLFSKIRPHRSTKQLNEKTPLQFLLAMAYNVLSHNLAIPIHDFRTMRLSKPENKI